MDVFAYELDGAPNVDPMRDVDPEFGMEYDDVLRNISD